MPYIRRLNINTYTHIPTRHGDIAGRGPLNPSSDFQIHLWQWKYEHVSLYWRTQRSQHDTHAIMSKPLWKMSPRYELSEKMCQIAVSSLKFITSRIHFSQYLVSVYQKDTWDNTWTSAYVNIFHGNWKPYIKMKVFWEYALRFHILVIFQIVSEEGSICWKNLC